MTLLMPVALHYYCMCVFVDAGVVKRAPVPVEQTNRYFPEQIGSKCVCLIDSRFRFPDPFFFFFTMKTALLRFCEGLKCFGAS